MTQMKSKPFPFYICEKLKHKLDLLIEQLEQNDVWLLIDGEEGSGKTNTAAYIMYYVHCMTGRPFSVDRFYFDSDAMFEWAKTNEKGLINWDEAALGGLSTEWWNNSQRNLIKFAMTGRKKHHFFVLCIPHLMKLAEYLRVDRSRALIHMDLGRKGNRYGHAMWISRRGKRILCSNFRKKKFLDYHGSMRKFGGFYFDIPYIFDKLEILQRLDKNK